MAETKDLYARVTDKIIADLEAGVRPWHLPWNSGHMDGRITRPLRHCGTPYRVINTILLWAAATENAYGAPIWMTYRQASALGGQVRKGSKGQLVVYADRMTKTETDDRGQEREVSFGFWEGYTVFNVEQIERLPDHYYAKPPAPEAGIARDERLETFFTSTGAEIRSGGNRAYYAVEPDYVQMPPIEAFADQPSYYATLAHEMVHWTRHPKRLARSFGRKKWGDEGYAKEELVAELGAAFLCADLSITPEVRPEHGAYIDDWLRGLKADKRLIIWAGAYAQAAADHLHKLQPAQAEAA